MPNGERPLDDGHKPARALSDSFRRATKMNPHDSSESAALEPFSIREIDRVSLQFLMGHEVSPSVPLNASAQSSKEFQEKRHKSQSTGQLLTRLIQIRVQIERAEALIQAIENRIEYLQTMAAAYQQAALEMFERAEDLENLMTESLQETERSRAIELLTAAGRREDLASMPLLQLAELIEAQIRIDRSSGTESYNHANETRELIEEIAVELERRRAEAERLRQVLDESTNDELLYEQLTRTSTQLKEDLILLAGKSHLPEGILRDVAEAKQSSLEADDEACDFTAEISSLNLHELGSKL